MSNQEVLKAIEEKLNLKDVVTLNDIHEELGIPPTIDGHLVEWKKVNGEWIFSDRRGTL